MDYRAAWTRWVAVAALAATACGPSSSSDGDGSGSSGQDDGPGDSSGRVTSGPGDSSGSPPGTTGEGSTDGSTSAGDTSTGAEGCPPRERFAADFTVSPDVDVSATCTVTAVGGDPGLSSIDLDCEGAPINLSISHSADQGPPYVMQDQLVRLEYITDPIFWINRWFSLHTADGEVDWLLAGGISGSSLDPLGTTIDAFFAGSPGVTVAEVAGECELVADGCGQFQRLALDFGIPEGGPTRVLDGQTGFVDVLAYGYRFDVQTAIRYEKPVQCEDLPATWYQVLVTYFPSD